MRIMTAAFAIGTALVLCSLGTSSASAQTRHKVVHAPRERLFVTPVPGTNQYWDSYIVPRYRYRPEDDRVDPYGPPPVPVIRFGPQEETVRWDGPGWWGW
jgi:hypothetical protein